MGNRVKIGCSLFFSRKSTIIDKNVRKYDIVNKTKEIYRQGLSKITFSFWYAVTAMNSVSLKTYVLNVE